MNTKDQIIFTADRLLTERGFNAFSYKNISEQMGIKTSSIHYYFPTKTDLGIAIIQNYRQLLEQTIKETEKNTPLEKINALFQYYKQLASEKKVCIVGALISDVNTLKDPLRDELLNFTEQAVNRAASILEQGQNEQIFRPAADNRLKARLMLTSLMGLIQISRIEKNHYPLDQAMQSLLDGLIIK